MRRRWFSSVFVLAVAVLLSAPATAQTIAYTNFLAFDLQSYRSQATGGMFDDDIENVADAAKLMNVEGNRLFTSFSNLADPAGFGDNVLSYSVDHAGAPTGSDHYDTGSYLVGWIGKYDKDSEYNFSAFYQRNSARGMFEDLNGAGDDDAEFSGTSSTTSTSPTDPYDVTAVGNETWDYTRYSQRSASDFDLGAARDMSEDLSVGGRVFFEKDQLDYFSNGTAQTSSDTYDHDTDPSTLPLRTSQTNEEFFGNGEEAYKYRNLGVSFSSDYHAWENQSMGVRLDVFHAKEVNPGFLAEVPSTFNGPALNLSRRIRNGIERDYTFHYTSGASPNGGNPNGSTGSPNPLTANRMDVTSETFYYNDDILGGRTYSPATESIDDERSGLGFALKGEYNREWAGGDINSWAGFSHQGMTIEATQVDAYRYEERRWWNDSATDQEAVYTESIVNTENRNGDTTYRTFEAGGRWNRDLNSNVSLGIGGVVTSRTGKDDYESVLQANYDEMTVDGVVGTDVLLGLGGGFDEGSFAERTTTTHNVVDETKTTTLRLPVGVQFHFKDRWTFNMGLTHTQMNYNREVEASRPAGLNEVTVTTVVDESAGTTTTTRSVSEDAFDETITDRGRTNHTTYWYGIAVDITDAVQLDVNGFFDSHSTDRGQTDSRFGTDFTDGSSSQILDVDFWRNLAISLKFIFW